MRGLIQLIAALLLLVEVSCASPFKTSLPMVTRSSRQSRRGRSSADAVNIFDAPGLAKFRLPLATFIKQLDKASGSRFGRFYLLRTNEWKSLARILGLGPKSYSALLLACELVEVQKLDNGKRQLEDKKKSRRTSESSVYTEVDRIFQKHGANRAHYFGRKFEGVDIRKIMNQAIVLFGKDEDCEDGVIRQALLRHVHGEEKKVLVKKVCHELGHAFILWDKVFKMVHEIDPSPEHCDATQIAIDLAMTHLRKLGMSIIPKLHGMEAHIVSQMRHIRGGICKLVEHWVEHYHQVGYRYDISYCRMGSLEKQAATRSSKEAIARAPKVRMCKKRREEQKKKRTRKNTKKEEAEVKRQERLEDALDRMKVKVENMKDDDRSLKFLSNLNSVVVLDDDDDVELILEQANM